jgi:hypothetical protein
VAGGLVISGLSLTEVSWWFLLLAALGALGPGFLREIGWLDDKDEFQRRADHRAGYHAFLTAGLVAFVLVAFFRSGERAIEHTHRIATLFLSLLWFTWFFSSMLAYWGPRRAATWILRVFGSVVLVFAIISNLGTEWTGWAALLLHPLLAAPFFLLAWLSGRRPRISGVLLLAVFAALLLLFGAPRVSKPSEMTDGVVGIFVLGPLLASGIALLWAGKKNEDPEDADEMLVPDSDQEGNP